MMELELKNWYKILCPRPVVLISTIDTQGISNAAPYSFVMPISCQPAMVGFASGLKRHTLTNIRETKEFILNIPSEEIIDQVWQCAKPYPCGVSEIRETGLTEKKAEKVSVPRIGECIGWIECRYEFEQEIGDHVLIVGHVLYSQVKDEWWKDDKYQAIQAKPLLHIGGSEFGIPGWATEPVG
ncbi:MAG: flavin reductase family protein [Candidatus Desantisbacteria bacterium]